LTANKTVTASFVYGEFTLTVNAVSNRWRTVTKTPDQPTYMYPNANVTLQAIPNPGYTFVNWTLDQTGATNPVTIQMIVTKTIQANFTNMYALTVSLVGTGTVTKTPNASTYLYGTTVTVRPNAGNRLYLHSLDGANAGRTGQQMAMAPGRS